MRHGANIWRHGSERRHHLLVAKLRKIFIPGTDTEIRVRRLERDDVIGYGLEALDRL